MKVLYIIHSTIMGGATVSFLNMIEGLKKNKKIIPYVVFPANSENNQLLIGKLKEFEIEYFPIQIIMSIYPKIKNLKDVLFFPFKLSKLIVNKYVSLNKLKSIVVKISPDIIHTNTSVIREGYKVAKMFKIPHCLHIREYQDKDFNMRILPTKQLFISSLKSDNVIAITNDLIEHFHLKNSENAHVIYNGVLYENEKNYIHDKEKYFLCASRISPEKGINEAIKGFAEFCKTNSDYNLLIAGFSSNKKYMIELQKLVEKLGLTGKVEFLGFKNKQEIEQLMSKSCALIVASKCEAFGRMTAEANFYGCFVIGRNSGGTCEILENTKGGWLYNNQVELTKFMHVAVNLAGTEQYREKITNAQNVAVAAYSIEQNVNKIFNLYSWLIQKQNIFNNK